MELDGLYVPINEPWYPALRSELLSFPAGKHDDMVDALGLIGQILDRMNAGTKPQQRPPLRGLTGNDPHGALGCTTEANQ
jgi:hypothetical protein